MKVSIANIPSDPAPTQIGTGAPITEPVISNPPTVLGVIDLFQTTVVGHSRQSRSTTRLVGFELTFDEPLDAATATIRGDYTVLAYQLHGRQSGAAVHRGPTTV